VRLLLDAHLSPSGIGERLRGIGHDVRCIAEESALEGLDDPEVLELAAAEGRILVTRASRDFARILREWAEAGRSHGGCMLIGHDQFAEIVAGVKRLPDERPDQGAWRDLVLAV